ncbi:glycoside hydrolase family 73 protein [Apilactobacillus kunkeei]|uniref:Muramidase n=1 Tax=Apilactobacillus kunkeei TaxID=148814 RepID=A0A1L8CIZ1_9LACO|nr:glucosaminidase domain-containing protein [Apilactobacillus kunkeei]GAT91152.1 muramidase [Apilactobacillus kunkeei]
MRRKPIVKSLLYVLSASAVISAGHVYVSHADDLDNGANNTATAATVNTNVTADSSINNILGSQLTADNFISTISPIAQSIANSNNLYASTMVAQAALESGYGTSYLTQIANNLFGIKSFDGTGVKLKTSEYNSKGQAYSTYAYFKSYNSVVDSLQGYATFLTVNSRYANVFKSQAKDGIEAATNIQKDGYATDPSYATKLINLIKTYNLTALDGNTSSTNTNTNTPSTNSSSNTTNANNTTNTQSTTTKPKKTLATATYTYGNPLETFQLSSKFANYNLYTHVKDTTAKNVTGNWPSHLKAGSNVYVDCLAVRTYKGASTTWYRIKTSKNAKSYWVTAKAIDFPTIHVKQYNGKAKLSQANRGLYSNVFNSQTLAKSLGSSNSYKDQTFNVNQIATYTYHGKENTWYRINVSNLGDVWVNKTGVTYTKAERKVVKKKVTKKKAKKVAKKKTTTKSSVYSKASGHAYLNNYGKFALYNHIPGTSKHIQKTAWSQVKVPKDYKVGVNLKGIRAEYNTTWYRIVLNHKNYWISAKSLLFY